jgi:hypothetical protein
MGLMKATKVLLLAVGVGIVCAGMFIFRPTAKVGTTPEDAHVTIVSGVVELGLVRIPVGVDGRISITNNSGGVVKVVSVLPSCSCIHIWPVPISITPHSQAEIRVELRIDAPEAGHQTMMLETEFHGKRSYSMLRLNYDAVWTSSSAASAPANLSAARAARWHVNLD